MCIFGIITIIPHVIKIHFFLRKMSSTISDWSVIRSVQNLERSVESLSFLMDNYYIKDNEYI